MKLESMNMAGCLAMGLFLSLGIHASSFARADERRDNSEMNALIRPISDSVQYSVAQVISGGRPVALATVVSSDGYLLTKRSELSGDPIRIRLHDGRLYPARVAAVRRRNDLALLRIDADVSLTPLQLSDQTPPVASFLISAGRTGRPVGIGVLGVQARKIEHHGRLGVMLVDNVDGRAVVDEVFPNSGADSAGVVRGDLIVAINGHQEVNKSSVIETLRGMFPGEDVRLTILRPGTSQALETLEMDARIRDFHLMKESENDSRVNGPRNDRLSGFDRVIQHDTVLDPDECGGPVLDTSGRVVGINIARAGRVVSYALPSSLVMAELVSMLQEARGAE
ncbi:serine endoprotease [Rubripirellula tenax]|uniref:Serine endoprotease n=1 Tax=Rubripirellula tenax TaxID=2528015 RepID=A0A5C6EIK9_9BACT|nr:trypsin-like peptidase domain-containing protein [Rubripirellula tenax]TWU47481.1 serine endoprotease [Rubripirellula tenax]